MGGHLGQPIHLSTMRTTGTAYMLYNIGNSREECSGRNTSFGGTLQARSQHKALQGTPVAAAFSVPFALKLHRVPAVRRRWAQEGVGALPAQKYPWVLM